MTFSPLKPIFFLKYTIETKLFFSKTMIKNRCIAWATELFFDHALAWGEREWVYLGVLKRILVLHKQRFCQAGKARISRRFSKAYRTFTNVCCNSTGSVNIILMQSNITYLLTFCNYLPCRWFIQKSLKALILLGFLVNEETQYTKIKLQLDLYKTQTKISWK